MIYTCTINPSLDYYMEFDKSLKMDSVNRSQLEYYEAGGKGINVSIVLNNLMIPSRALGFLGGFTKDFFIELLQKYEYVQPSFTYIDGHTRINLKLKGEIETDLNASGPYITNENIEALKKKVEKLDEKDVFIFSGDAPAYLIDEIEDMIKNLSEKNVKIVLDTNHRIIEKCLKYKPFLIRLNTYDLGLLLNEDLSDKNFREMATYCDKLRDMQAENVIMQLGSQGAIIASSLGMYHSNIPQNQNVVNTVGANDSIVAGFVMNFLRSNDIVDSFKFASCCLVATTFLRGLATREKVNDLYDTLEVEKL